MYPKCGQDHFVGWSLGLNEKKLSWAPAFISLLPNSVNVVSSCHTPATMTPPTVDCTPLNCEPE